MAVPGPSIRLTRAMVGVHLPYFIGNEEVVGRARC
jgi:hypothetical protein